MNDPKNWNIIETEKEYTEAMERFHVIFQAKKDTPESKEFKLLSLVIGEYEKRKFKFPDIDPIEFIKIRMEDFGYKPADLAREYGDKGTVSKVLNYKQPLSLTMIRKFSKMLHIPPEFLIKEYKTRQL